MTGVKVIRLTGTARSTWAAGVRVWRLTSARVDHGRDVEGVHPRGDRGTARAYAVPLRIECTEKP